jgi:hypothetical protein
VQALIADLMPITGLVKTHNLLGSIKEMPTINASVSVGAVYVVRDPRDVALSLARFLEASIDDAIKVLNTQAYVTNNSARGAGEVWGSWSEHARSWTDARDDSVMVVRYEDMLARPTETFDGIARHLRLPASPVQVNEAVALASFDNLRETEARVGFVERTTKSTPFFASGKAGVWRERLSALQIGAILDAHGAAMTRFGYAA